VKINSNPLLFKIDSGADVTIITEGAYKNMTPRPIEKKPKKILFGAGHNLLRTICMFTANITWKNNLHKEDIYVVANQRENLLGGDACEILGLFTFNIDSCKVGTRNKEKQVTAQAGRKCWDPKKRFPKLFTGLGKLKVEYKIKLKENATPYSTTAPRKIPYKMMKPLKKKIDSMEEKNVISKITENTEWCTHLVCVPKNEECTEIRPCVDLIKLNEAVVRDRIMLPSVDESLSQMAGAKVFSKIRSPIELLAGATTPG
jgi:hypothetical protein